MCCEIVAATHGLASSRTVVFDTAADLRLALPPPPCQLAPHELYLPTVRHARRLAIELLPEHSVPAPRKAIRPLPAQLFDVRTA